MRRLPERNQSPAGRSDGVGVRQLCPARAGLGGKAGCERGEGRAVVEEVAPVIDSEPWGCAHCNPAAVLPWLDARKLVALDVPASTPGAIPCEECQKVWWVVSLETAESP